MVLSAPRNDEERAALADTGPYISTLIYEAKNLDQAFGDAEWAGMQVVSAPAEDEMTGVRTALLREPSGNLIELRQAQSA